MGLDRRGGVARLCYVGNPQGEDPAWIKQKPFGISKREVWMAYERVKANRGAAGVDDQTIAEFREGFEEQSLSALESNVVGQLHAAASSSS